VNADRIGKSLKGQRNGSGWLICCPVPGHGKGRGDRSPSLSVADGDEGRLLLQCFAGCKFLEVLDALKRLGLINDLAARGRLRPFLRPVEREHEPDPAGLLIWRNANRAPIPYLERRGLPSVPASLRCGIYLHLGQYEFPCMVAAVQRPDGKVVAVQQTVLTPKATKAPIANPKQTTGAFGAGAVRFAAAAEVMGIGEGVETCLSAQTMAEIPVWASLGCRRLHRVELPELVREVHIFGDNDEPGRAAAHRTSEVHLALGRRVVLRFPPEGLKDFNDLLNADADETLRDLRPDSVKARAAA
jgi:putative DNA primase/helicase